MTIYLPGSRGFRRQQLRKHRADHDEKSHGNWARGRSDVMETNQGLSKPVDTGREVSSKRRPTAHGPTTAERMSADKESQEPWAKGNRQHVFEIISQSQRIQEIMRAPEDQSRPGSPAVVRASTKAMNSVLARDTKSLEANRNALEELMVNFEE